MESVGRRMVLGRVAAVAGAAVFPGSVFAEPAGPGGKRGIVDVTRGPADLVVPADGDGFRYGTG